MGVFDNCSVLFELKHLSFKEKKKLKSAVTENGGSISFVINEQCSLVVTSDVSNLSSNRLRSIQKHYTPVVSLDYVHSCVERGTLLPVDGYELVPPCASPDPLPLNPPWRASTTYQAEQPSGQDSAVPADETFRTYKESDSDLPAFPDDFQVAKYSFFAKANSSTWCVLELQSSRTQQGQCYRVVRYWKDDVAAKKVAVRDQLVFLSTSEKALDVYEALTDQLDSSGLQRMSSIPPEVPHLGSAPLQQLLLEEKLNTGSLSQEVAVFVEMLWTEALGCLSNILRVSTNQLSLNDVSRAEGLLLQAQKKLKEGNQSEASSLLKEVYVLLPHREPRPPFPTARFLSQKLDLCQLIRDVLNVSEMNLRTPEPSCVGKYRALQCSIEAVPPDSTVFQNVADLLHDSPVQIQQIMRVSRRVELQTFKSDLGNIKPLLHSSSPSNFVGILSRGLLLPRVGVEHHGIERTDAGNIGSGIYFSDSMSTSLKYSKPSQTDGSRLLLVCDVALGRCKNIYERDQTLSQAPEGHHSVHGVRCTHTTQTDFEDDEFVVYAPDQVKVKYVVLFTVEGDQLKDFQPAVNTSAEPGLSAPDEELVSVADDIENIKNPLDGVTAGLLDSSGQQLPLQAVHVKCKLMDLLSQVVIFQKYTNLSSVPIEAKYVFPLDDSAAVCGFEAFINGKHVVGQVKEKETARKEYKQAIEKGHGAYLMDQEAPDVFTISVGNLPPGATVLIKVTFVSELVIRDGKILFSLPGSVAPWQESAALNQTTQVSVEKVRVTDEAAGSREFTLDLSVEMPYEINDLVCITHKVMIKETDCKAVVRILPGQVMGPDGFQLSIQLTEVHLPRMWVEKHPDKDSQACMLVFYPDIDLDSDFKVEELVLLLDTSESMRGESLRQAQNIALHVLKKIENDVRINVVLFGTDHAEAFLKAQPLSQVHQAAQTFIKRCSPAGGSTELWRPLRALSLMPPSRGIRALLLLSDGHIQNAALTLQLLRDNVQHSRLFTCGVSPTANRHMLRALAQAGGGAYEFFDTKTKHNWAEKALRQVERLSGPHCSSISVKWQQFNPTAPSPVQAPKQLSALFSDCHTLVYGFVPHCTQATLLGNLHGQELNTMVSTTELQKTTGTFLHKLTARALIRDYEDGSLDTAEAEHEGKKAELKSFVIELSKEFSILSQFTSFVAIEERDSTQPEDGITDIPKLIAEEDVDFLPYIGWTFPPAVQEAEDIEISSSSLAGSQVSEGSDEEECYLIGPSESEEEWICKARKAKPKEGKAAMQSENISAHARRLMLANISEGSDDEECYLIGPSEKEGRYRSKPSRAQLSSRVDFESVFLGNRAEALKGKASILPAPNRARAAPPPGYSPTSPSYTPPVLLGASVPATGLFSPAFGTTGYGALTGQSGLFGSSRAAASSPMLHSYAPTPAVAQGAFEAASRRFRSAPNAPIVDLQTFTFSSAAPQPEADRAPCSEPEVQHSTEVKMSGWEKEFQGRRESYDSQPLRRRSFHQNMSFHLPPPPPPCAPGVPRASLDVLPPPCPPGVPRASLDVLPPPCPPGVLRASLDVLPPRSTGYAHMPPLDLSFFSSSPSPLDGSPSSYVSLSTQASVRHKLEKKLKVSAVEAPPDEKLMKPKKRRHYFCGFLAPPGLPSVESRDPDPEELKHKWTKIFQLQHSEGFWELTTELGDLLNLNVDVFGNVFLRNKGINSLGMKAHADILRMVATLLVLQLLKMEKQEEGKLLRSLFRLDESSLLRPERWEQVKKAVDWMCWADRQYPCICSRLELGLNWESTTRQLLGFDSFPPFSPLIGLNLRPTATPQRL